MTESQKRDQTPTTAPQRESPGATYERLLARFEAEGRPTRDAIAYLMEQGYSRGQARNAVYRFRQRHGQT